MHSSTHSDDKAPRTSVRPEGVKSLRTKVRSARDSNPQGLAPAAFRVRRDPPIRTDPERSHPRPSGVEAVPHCVVTSDLRSGPIPPDAQIRAQSDCAGIGIDAATCACGRARQAGRAVCCGACERGEHFVACEMRQITAGSAFSRATPIAEVVR